jgi:aminopeptidase N
MMSKENAPERESNVLLKTEAEERYGRVSNIHYELDFILNAEKTYRGSAIINFRHRGPKSKPLRVDFLSSSVSRADLNGKSLEINKSEGAFLLPANSLQNDNTLVIEYENIYARDGIGFHWFQDPEDHESYVHTDFEPYNAHRVFPCFDQPDLKATYRIAVTAPAHWKVITNSLLEKQKPAGKDLKTWRFKATKPFSTYLVAIVAGPFAEWKSKAGSIPLGLFARKSVQKYMDADEFFEITRQGFAFYQDYFDVPYPFEKYDQILLPEYNMGAMENVGAVTFNEGRYVYRRQATEVERQERGNTILHELAHMWFGNLVTMKWWDDLWLNESFATFMADFVLEKATRFKESWLEFYAGTKSWAYTFDQKATTHPIVADVKDTEQAFSNFDGITYGKGASALKQLHYYIGPDNFRKGMQKYFKKYAYQNTVLEDFLSALSTASGKNLTSWSKEWLLTAGVNPVTSEWSCVGPKLKSFSIVQGPANQSQSLRTHRTELALIYEVNGALGKKVLSANYTGGRTQIAELVGAPCPKAVLLNHNDYDFAKVAFDPESLKYLSGRLSSVTNTLDRLMIWETLWSMLRDQTVSARTYMDLVLKYLPNEQAPMVIAALVHHTKALTELYLDDATLATTINSVERTLLNLAGKNFKNKKATQMWLAFDSFVAIAQTNEGLKALRLLLEGTEPSFKGLNLEQERRWNVISRLAAFNDPAVEKYVAQESARDSSDLGLKKRYEIQVIRNDSKAKEDAWRDFFKNPRHLSLEMVMAGAAGFYRRHQLNTVNSFFERFFDDIQDLYADQSLMVAQRTVRALYPVISCDHAVLKKSKQITQRESTPRELKRMLLNWEDELERCIRVRSAQ